MAHAAGVQAALHEIQGEVRASGGRLDARLVEIERDLRGVISHRALVRYDAYNELSGRQSISIALLDDERSGIVLSCIHHRDQARVYAKQMRAGRSERELSPEEARPCGWRSPAATAKSRLPQMAAPRGPRAAAARLSRPRGNVQRGGPPRERRPRCASSRWALSTHLRHGDGVGTG